jgi:Cu/Ag efflux pump CusA
MTRILAGWSLSFRYVILGVAAALLVYGALRLPTVPVGVVPDFNPPYVEVQTEALGLSANEVEQMITVPLEADLLQGVAFLDEIESQSVAGLSSIVLRFDPGTDIFRARQVVAERLTQAHALPNVSKPPLMLQPLSSTNRVLMASMTSGDVPLIDMSILARWTIRPRLLGVPGVANVSIWGLRERQLQVLVDPSRLRDQRVSLQHVLETAGNAMWVSPLTFLDASTPGTGGFIDTPNQRLGVQHVFPIRSAADLAKVPVAPEDTAGRIIRLGDIAEVVEDHQPLIGDAIVGGGAGLMLVVEKFPDADTRSVTRGVEGALAALQPGLAGIQIDSTVFRPASYVESAIAGVSLAALLGIVLLVLSVLILFRGWRAALVTLLAVLVSLVAATVVLDLLGKTINAMTIAGLVLAVALIVDEAVIGVDAVRRRFQAPRDGDADRQRTAIALEATLEGRGPMLVGTLVTITLAVPLFFVTGIAGAFLPELALAYLVAILVAAVVALTLIPALSSFLLTGPPSKRRPAVMVERVQRAYGGLLSRLVERRRARTLTAAAVAFGLVAIVGSVVAPLVAGPLVPSFRERQLLISWNAAPGTSRPEMNRIVGRASQELRAVVGVTNVGAHVGRAVVSDQVVGINSGEIWVTINPSADYDATVQTIGDVVAGYPGIDHTVLTYSNQRIGEVLASTGDDLVVRVYGHELDALAAKAHEVREAISTIDGVAGAAVDEPVFEPTVEIEVDLDSAQRYGIKAGDVRRAAAILLSGVEVGSIFEDQKVFSVVVWGRPEIRQNLTSIRDLPVQAPGGAYVRLGDVADVRVAPSPSVIHREGVFRRIDIGVAINGRDLAAVTNDVESRLAGLTFPEEYHAEIRPVGAARQADLARLIAIAAAALIWSFLLIQAAIGRWRLAGLLFLALPSAVLGSVIGMVNSGGGASLGTVLGGIAVLAIAVRQAILLVDRCRSLERAGEDFGSDLVMRAARDSFLPILTTATATALALLPAIVLGDVAGLEIVRPMAVTIIAGLLTSSVFTLVVIPALYLQSGPSGEPDPASQLLEQPGLSAA